MNLRLILILMLCASILASVHITRDRDELIGARSYYHLFLAEEAREGATTNDLFYGERDHSYAPVDILLSMLDDPVPVVRFLPMGLGVVSCLLYYLIIRRTRMGSAALTTTVLSMSPVFIYTFTVWNDFFIIVFLTLASVYFLVESRFLLGMIAMALIPAFDLKMFIVPLILLSVYYYHASGRQRYEAVMMIIAASLFYVFIQNRSDFVFPTNLLKDFISDTGAVVGPGIFVISLALLGIFVSWKKKREFLVIYIILLSSMLFYVYIRAFLIFMDMILVFLAGIAMKNLLERKWEFDLIRNYVLLLVFCGLFFSAASYAGRVANFPPSAAEIDSMRWLRENTKYDEVVLSDYQNGLLLQSVARRPVVTDEIYFLSSRERIRINDSMRVFSSRSYQEARALLDKYAVDYIYINPSMRERVWKKDDEGLLLLMRTSQNFRQVYGKDGVEIWGHAR